LVANNLLTLVAGNAVMAFNTNSAERMRIDASGNVGIGTVSPYGKLNVFGTSVVLSNPAGTSNDSNGVNITTFSSGTPYWSYLTYNASHIEWQTYNLERMRLDPNGNLCVGTTAASGKLTSNGSSSIAAYFVSSGSFAVYGTSSSTHSVYGIAGSTTNGGIAGVSQNGTYYGILGHANAWALYGNGSTYISGTYQGSDARLKDNVTTLQNALTTIKSLRPVTFDWKANTDSSLDGPHTDCGMIAQEVLDVLPHVVREVVAAPVMEGRTKTLNQELGTFYSMDYGKLIPYLVAAIQELAAEVAALKAPSTP
jgi:hypothetical protein